MRRAVWAVYFHTRQTDDLSVQHCCCDPAWCKYKQAVRDGTVANYNQSGVILPAAVLDKVYPIFKDLARTELLKKCLGGHTQNANERPK